MGLKNMSLLTGATIAVSGGTPLVFADDGVTIQNGVHLVVPSDTSFVSRRQCTVKYKPPTVDVNTGTFGKEKKTVSFTVPIQVGDKIVFNTVRIEREIHPEFTDGEELLKTAAQLCVDSDMANFWSVGSLT